MGIFAFFSSKPPTPVPHIIKPTVLIIEDEQYLRDFYEELFQGEGYEVMTATNGKEGIEKAQQHPNVILLDLMMPIMSGQEVLQVLWDNPQTKTIPVIVLTNAGSIENMDKAKFFSAYKFFIKSNVSPEEIISTVAQVAPLPKPSSA